MKVVIAGQEQQEQGFQNVTLYRVTEDGDAAKAGDQIKQIDNLDPDGNVLSTSYFNVNSGVQVDEGDIDLVDSAVPWGPFRQVLSQEYLRAGSTDASALQSIPTEANLAEIQFKVAPAHFVYAPGAPAPTVATGGAQYEYPAGSTIELESLSEIQNFKMVSGRNGVSVETVITYFKEYSDNA